MKVNSIMDNSSFHIIKAHPLCASDSEESACNAEDLGSFPALGRSLWRRKWQPTPVFLPGKFHG